MNDTATNRPPTVKQLEARAAKAQKARHDAWGRLVKARSGLSAAFDNFNDALSHETAAFQTLCAARQGRTPDPAAPPAPETLTAVDEED